MFCSKCGVKLPDGANVCPSCGKPAAGSPAQHAAAPAPRPAPQPTPQAPPAPSAQTYNPPPADSAPIQTAAGSLDIGRSFSFAFQDGEWWKKCLILGLIVLIPIVGFLVLVGYIIEVVRDAASGSDLPLPDIDFGNQLSVGFSFFIAYLVFALAIAAVFGIIYIPFMVMSKMNGIGLIFMLLGTLIQIVLSVSLNMYMFAGQSVAILENNPWAIFQVGRILPGVKANLLNCFLVLVLTMAFAVIGYAGAIACGVGLLVSIPLSMIMYGHILGQLGRIMKESGV
jgi:hypothetical protein